jgi:cardiolipin synthase
MDSLELSDGSPLCDDFTAAAVVQDTTRLRQLQAVFSSLPEETVEITKETLNSHLLDRSEATEPLSVPEFNAFMVSLANTHAATEYRSSSEGYGKYTFTVKPDAAVRVLDQQVVAALATQQRESARSPSTDVQLVATLPQEVEKALSVDVERLDIALRRMLVDASEIVRVANPYFDSDQWIIDDLAALPKRGVETRVLTREMTGESADQRALDAITALVEDLTTDEVQLMSIRDFYETSSSGHQTGAVHAKIISVGDEQCYIGSANLTDLNLRGNFEFGVILEGPLVTEVTAVFDAIFSHADPVPV